MTGEAMGDISPPTAADYAMAAVDDLRRAATGEAKEIAAIESALRTCLAGEDERARVVMGVLHSARAAVARVFGLKCYVAPIGNKAHVLGHGERHLIEVSDVGHAWHLGACALIAHTREDLVASVILLLRDMSDVLTMLAGQES